MHSTARSRQPMAAAASRDDSDHDSSCSSFSTALDSRRSWISDVSFGSSSSISVRSYCGANGGDGAGHLQQQLLKPHKANQAEWEAIRRLRAACGHVRLDHFRIVRRLGSGDLGNVYLCQLRDPRSPGCLYAMKVVDREALAFRKKLQRAETEKEILRSLDHPFLPTLYADFDAAHYSCLVMEFCPGGDLHVVRQRQPGRRFSISSAKFYAAETLLALEYLHMMGVVYRDLKPENVLVRDDGHIMLSDFDLSLKCDVVPKLMMQRLSSKLAAKNAKGSSSSCVPPMQPVLSCFYGGGGSSNANKCDKRGKTEDDDDDDAGRSGARPGARRGAHRRAVEVVRGHARVPRPGGDLRRRPRQRRRLVGPRRVPLRDDLRQDAVQRRGQREDPHQHHQAAAWLPQGAGSNRQGVGGTVKSSRPDMQAPGEEPQEEDREHEGLCRDQEA
ncbi:unnamed protein product [Musa textilis]